MSKTFALLFTILLSQVVSAQDSKEQLALVSPEVSVYFNTNGFHHQEPVYHFKNDTIAIELGLGESILNQRIKLSSRCTNVTIEQQYETSLVIGNEGPHLDLIDWKHYTSDWELLKATAENRFRSKAYSVKDEQKFPEVNNEEIVAAVKTYFESFPGNRSAPQWISLVKEVSNAHQYPCCVAISRVFFKVKGKSNGKTFEKTIVFQLPMGC
jgi:hypothetical protein